nr:XRE family transcriptional regulator [Clostridium ganghwense]
MDIGTRIKELRTKKKLTLKDLSEKTNLSIGFLSQLERGLTTIAIDCLENIAEILGVDLGYFFTMSKKSNGYILRGHEREIIRIEESKFIHYQLSNDLKNKNILPRLIEILPSKEEEEIVPYQHQGEEFVYVLEGILTIYIGNERHELFPGDTAHFKSDIVHNWANYTNKIVKLLVVSTPNNFKVIN